MARGGSDRQTSVRDRGHVADDNPEEVGDRGEAGKRQGLRGRDAGRTRERAGGRRVGDNGQRIPKVECPLAVELTHICVINPASSRLRVEAALS